MITVNNEGRLIRWRGRFAIPSVMTSITRNQPPGRGPVAKFKLILKVTGVPSQIGRK